LDGYALIKNRKKHIEDNLSDKINTLVEDLQNYLGHIDQSKADSQKSALFRLSMLMLDRYEKSYDTILPVLIDSLTVEIEKELKKNFSEQELIELDILIQNPIITKLIQNKNVFAVLKSCEIKMDMELHLQLLESLTKVDISSNFNDILDEYNKNMGKDKSMYDEYYFDEEDNDDLWNDEKDK